MKVKTRNLGWLAVGGFLLLAIACTSPQPAATSSPGEPTATPNIPATEAARVQAAPAGTPTPTPVPPLVSQVTLDFATGHRTIGQDWDQLHRDFDAWRKGLIACDASSVQASLRGFSGSSSGITEAARGLPRHSMVRGLSDQLIQAAEREEEALRLLRDTWQPGPAGAMVASGALSNGAADFSDGAPSQTPRSVFEGVDIARSTASTLQKEVADQLNDLQVKTASTSQDGVNDFDSAFQDLNSAWDRFHQDYDSLRAEEGLISSTETVERLGRLVDQFRDIALAVRELPASPATDSVSQLLAQAAQEEDLALRRLRGTFQKSEEEAAAVEATDELPQEASETPEESSGEDPSAQEEENPPAQEEVTFVASDPTLFDAFDAQLVEANGARRQAKQELAAVLEDVSKDSRAAVEGFASQYDLLLGQWSGFHREYDDWRRTEGGCDRTKAIDKLGEFTLSFADLSSSVRGLPRATFLQPLGELMVEAAEREEVALRELRNTWRPFDAQAYQTLEQQRNAAGRLRRQVALGIQELLERYDLPAPEG